MPEDGPAVALDRGQRLPGGGLVAGLIAGQRAEPGGGGAGQAADLGVQGLLEVGGHPGPVGQDGQAGRLLPLPAQLGRRAAQRGGGPRPGPDQPPDGVEGDQHREHGDEARGFDLRIVERLGDHRGDAQRQSRGRPGPVAPDADRVNDQEDRGQRGTAAHHRAERQPVEQRRDGHDGGRGHRVRAAPGDRQGHGEDPDGRPGAAVRMAGAERAAGQGDGVGGQEGRGAEVEHAQAPDGPAERGSQVPGRDHDSPPSPCRFIVLTPSSRFKGAVARRGLAATAARRPRPDVQHAAHDQAHDAGHDAEQAGQGERGVGVVVQHRVRVQQVYGQEHGGQDDQQGAGLQHAAVRSGAVTGGRTGPEPAGELGGDAEGEGQEDGLEDPVADGVRRAGRVVPRPEARVHVWAASTARNGTRTAAAARRGSRMIQPAMTAATNPASGVMANLHKSVTEQVSPVFSDTGNTRNRARRRRPAGERPLVAARHS